MILLPEKYNDINLSKEEKLFVNLVKSKLDNEDIALLKIKPIQEAVTNLFILSNGISFIETIAIDDLENFKIMINFYMQLHDMKVDKIRKKLSNHRLLIENGQLNILVNYKYYVSLIDKNIILNEIKDKNIIEFIDRKLIFKSEITSKFKEAESIRKTFLDTVNINKNEKLIEVEKANIIINQIAPEYTIPIYTEEGQKENLIGDDNTNYNYDVQDSQLDIQVFRLETEQINIINSIKEGAKLMLACAGSGKSVLLISKCFKVASMHQGDRINEGKRFLLTCFNKNLNDMYNWRINIAGFRERNVNCFTFHKLCMDLLGEANVSYTTTDFDEIFKIARLKLNDGTIKRRYFGIFIDEVQVFKPEWYEFCYDLLEIKEKDRGFFIVCGDKSQTIANNMKHGKAPWQGNPRLPNFKGNSIRLEKNYRNTIEINSYINKFTEVAKEYAESKKIQLKDDTDYMLRGKATRSGGKPQIIVADRYTEVQEVMNSVKYLNKEKHIDLCDIAILVPQRGYETANYNIYDWIIKKLESNDIECSDLSPKESFNRTRYGYRQGVTLCTINSALGLDFKAVIICGLYPVGAHGKTKSEKSMTSLTDEKTDDFRNNINMLYTAFTRARDELVIISSDKYSVYSKLIVKANNL